MKTPKRFICPAKDTLCGREKPCFPWKERVLPDHAECARWKRKNREAQLKRSIRRVWVYFKNVCYKLVDSKEFIRTGGTYGQDIEGS